eukprot:941704-Rhodomonas_salina.1
MRQPSFRCAPSGALSLFPVHRAGRCDPNLCVPTPSNPLPWYVHYTIRRAPLHLSPPDVSD